MAHRQKTGTLENLETAFSNFQRNYPAYRPSEINELRAREYARLDAQDHVYLDYTGSGLYAVSQIRKHQKMLEQGVFGNPHSKNPTSLLATHLVEQARDYVLEYFHASAEEYVVIFTPNASGALKLVGEAYPFRPGGRFLPLFDNHNSVNGIREFAMAKGAEVTYLPTMPPELRIDPGALQAELARRQPGAANLFAYPAQSNFTGVQHAPDWIARAQDQGWDVLLDAAAFVPTHALDLSRWKPDFVSLSFYKMFGYPTGVGCLLARKTALAKLSRPWFAGGTISITSVQGEGWHYLLEDEAGFEDGTVNFLNLPAIEIGLRFISEVGIDRVHERVNCLTGWLLEQMTAIRHNNGAPLVEIFGPTTMENRGGTISFCLDDPDGNRFDFRKIEALAYQEKISLRTGCFCNPGTGEIVHNLTREEMALVFAQPRGMSYNDFFEWARSEYGLNPSTIRISVGIASNFEDVYRFMMFLQKFVDLPASALDAVDDILPVDELVRDSA